MLHRIYVTFKSDRYRHFQLAYLTEKYFALLLSKHTP